jgi:hypothetical protein
MQGFGRAIACFYYTHRISDNAHVIAVPITIKLLLKCSRHHPNLQLKQQNLHVALDGILVKLGNSMISRSYAGLCLMLLNRNLNTLTKLI